MKNDVRSKNKKSMDQGRKKPVVFITNNFVKVAADPDSAAQRWYQGPGLFPYPLGRFGGFVFALGLVASQAHLR